MNHRDVCVIGNIGSGKTSFVSEFVRSNPNWQGFFELGGFNPFLQPMYEDPKRWAYSAQVSFLMHALKAATLSKSAECSIIKDWSIDVFYNVYIKLYHNLGWISDKEMLSLTDAYYTILGTSKPPSKYIYLSVSPRELKRRCARRGREGEEKLQDHLWELDRYYIQHVGELEATGARLVHVDCEALDIRTPRDYDILDRLVKEN